MNAILRRTVQIGGGVVVLYALYTAQAAIPKAALPAWMCGMDTRHIVVRVGPSCDVADKATLDVEMNWLPHQRMIWTLAPTGGARWQFAPRDGVQLIGSSTDPSQASFYARGRRSDRVFSWCNTNSDGQIYEYQINLVGPGSTTCVVDPFIINH